MSPTVSVRERELTWRHGRRTYGRTSIMKRILFVFAVLVATAALVARSYPNEFWA